MGNPLLARFACGGLPDCGLFCWCVVSCFARKGLVFVRCVYVVGLKKVSISSFMSSFMELSAF
jgi:hypothetical protein